MPTTKKKKAASTTRRARSYAKPPIPKQHQEPPGLESQMHPRPKFEAPRYRAANMLPGRPREYLIENGDTWGWDGEESLFLHTYAAAR